MHGLVSLLDSTHYTLVEEIWQELEIECGLKGIYITPMPHFSWQIAEDYDWDALEIALQEIEKVVLSVVSADGPADRESSDPSAKSIKGTSQSLDNQNGREYVFMPGSIEW